jgi:hypothetical protein
MKRNHDCSDLDEYECSESSKHFHIDNEGMSSLALLRKPIGETETVFYRCFYRAVQKLDSAMSIPSILVKLANEAEYCYGLFILLDFLYVGDSSSVALTIACANIRNGPPCDLQPITRRNGAIVMGVEATENLLKPNLCLDQLVSLQELMEATWVCFAFYVPTVAASEVHWAMVIFEVKSLKFMLLDPDLQSNFACKKKAEQIKESLEKHLPLGENLHFEERKACQQHSENESGVIVCGWMNAIKSRADLSLSANDVHALRLEISGILHGGIPSAEGLGADIAIFEDNGGISISLMKSLIDDDDSLLGKQNNEVANVPRNDGTKDGTAECVAQLYVVGQRCKHVKPWKNYKENGPCCKNGMVFLEVGLYYVVQLVDDLFDIKTNIVHPWIVGGKLMVMCECTSKYVDLFKSHCCPFVVDDKMIMEVLLAVAPDARSAANELKKVIAEGKQQARIDFWKKIVRFSFLRAPMLVPRKSSLKHFGVSMRLAGKVAANFDLIYVGRSAGHVLCLIRWGLPKSIEEKVVFLPVAAVQSMSMQSVMKELQSRVTGFSLLCDEKVWPTLKQELAKNSGVVARQVNGMLWAKTWIFWANSCQAKSDDGILWRIVSNFATNCFGTFQTTIRHVQLGVCWAVDEGQKLLKHVLELFGTNYAQAFLAVASMGLFMLPGKHACVCLDGNVDGVELKVMKMALSCIHPWSDESPFLLRSKKTIKELQHHTNSMVGGPVLVNPPDAHMKKAVISTILKMDPFERPQAFYAGAFALTPEEEQEVLTISNFQKDGENCFPERFDKCVLDLWKAAPLLYHTFSSIDSASQNESFFSRWRYFAIQLGGVVNVHEDEVDLIFELVQQGGLDDLEQSPEIQVNVVSPPQAPRASKVMSKLFSSIVKDKKKGNEQVVLVEAVDEVCFDGEQEFEAYDVKFASTRTIQVEVFQIQNVKCFKQQEITNQGLSGLALYYRACQIKNKKFGGMQYQVGGFARQKLAGLTKSISQRRGKNMNFIPMSLFQECFKK